MTQRQIREGVEALGLKPGATVVVHSSLKSFGEVEGGPDSVVAAVIDVVGPEGLIIMPLYRSSADANGDLVRVPEPGAKVTTGAIPAAFARRPDVRLAPNPQYTFALYGRDAEWYARKFSPLMFPYGFDQPLCCLRERRGWILQLGVNDSQNTAIHAVEEVADPAYLAVKKSQSRLTVDEFFAMPVEARRESLEKHRAGPRRLFVTCTPLIEQAGIRRVAMIGRGRAALTDAAAMFDVLGESFSRNPSSMVQG